MKLAKQKKEAQIPPTNLSSVKAAAGKKLADTPYYSLLQVLAAVCDSIAHENNAYSTVGGTKKGDALTLSVTENDDRNTFYGTSLVDLAQQSSAVLDDA